MRIVGGGVLGGDRGSILLILVKKIIAYIVSLSIFFFLFLKEKRKEYMGGGVELILLSPPFPPLFFARTGVVEENCLVLPVTSFATLLLRRIAGRDGEEMGILKAFASEARMGERGRIFFFFMFSSFEELGVSIGSFSNGDDNGVDGCPQDARSRSSKISARLYAPQAKRVEPLSDCRLEFQA